MFDCASADPAVFPPLLLPRRSVAVAALNSDRYIEALYAIPWAGGVVCALNFLLTPKDITYQLTDSAPQILIVDNTLSGLVQIGTRMPFVKYVIYAGEGPTPPDCLGYEDVIARAPGLIADAGRAENDDFAVLYLRGTQVGTPKRVIVSHLHACCGRFKTQDPLVYLHCSPLFLLSSLIAVMAATRAGGTHVVVSKFEAERVFKCIQDTGVTTSTISVAALNQLVASSAHTKYDCRSMLCIYYGNTSPSPQMDATMKKIFPRASVLRGYGLVRTSNRPDSPDSSRSEATLTEDMTEESAMSDHSASSEDEFVSARMFARKRETMKKPRASRALREQAAVASSSRTGGKAAKDAATPAKGVDLPDVRISDSTPPRKVGGKGKALPRMPKLSLETGSNESEEASDTTSMSGSSSRPQMPDLAKLSTHETS